MRLRYSISPALKFKEVDVPGKHPITNCWKPTQIANFQKELAPIRKKIEKRFSKVKQNIDTVKQQVEQMAQYGKAVDDAHKLLKGFDTNASQKDINDALDVIYDKLKEELSQ